jgi:hypothetical protein
VYDFGQTQGLSRTASARFNGPAVLLATAAAGLGVLATTVLGWFRHTDVALLLPGEPDDRWTFSRLGTALSAEQDRLGQAPAAVRAGIHLGIGPTYFGWLGFALVGAAVTLAVLAAAPSSRMTATARLLGFLVSVSGVAATLWALDLVHVDPNVVIRGAQRPPGYIDYVRATGPGAWAMLAAFALTLVAVTLPGRRERY